MEGHMHLNVNLTKNQSLVMDALSQADTPLSAYTILDELRDHGFRAPLQVYRALDKLIEIGLVHRLESLNAFIACNHPACEGHRTAAFMICNICNSVSEISDQKLTKQLNLIAKNFDFNLKKSTIELRGFCQNCKPA